MSQRTQLMTKGVFSVGVHQPIMNPNRGKHLAPCAPWDVFKVADYKECPDGWPRGDSDTAAFFLGTQLDRELWFDFRRMHQHTRHVAVVMSVQGVDAVTGMEVGEARMRQFKDECPVHEIPFGEDRFCSECEYKWPPQNYIAGNVSGREFWIDGWRSKEGSIRQFVFSDVEEGAGVAQQLLGEKRSVAIGFAFFLSKEPKPVPPPSPRRTRGSSQWLGGGGPGLKSGSYGGGTFGSSGGGMTLGADPLIGSLVDGDPYDSFEVHNLVPDMAADIGPAKGALRRVGAPMKQEVSYGREVDQLLHPDTEELSFWEEKPAAFIVLTPTDNGWVKEVTKHGPTADRTAGGKGFLKNVKGVSKAG